MLISNNKHALLFLFLIQREPLLLLIINNLL
nr:MAG TPA: hypothetical protein [Crassvirales sp.]